MPTTIVENVEGPPDSRDEMEPIRHRSWAMRHRVALAAAFSLVLVMAAQQAVLAVSPTITSFSPSSGPVGKLVTINGTDLSGATAVKFSGVNATVSSNTSSQIKATVPAGASTGYITVTTPGGTATSATKFKVTLGIVV